MKHTHNFDIEPATEAHTDHWMRFFFEHHHKRFSRYGIRLEKYEVFAKIINGDITEEQLKNGETQIKIIKK